MNKYPLYTALRIPLVPLFFLVFFPKVRGRKFLPKQSACILAGNHTSISDCLLLAYAVPKTLRFLAMQELFTPRWASFFKRVGCIPVNRKKPDPAALRSALRTLKSGGIIAVFPEGKISKTRSLGQFKSGVGGLALHGKVPVVPFCITGDFRPFGCRPTITFFPAQFPSGTAEEVTNKIKKVIQAHLTKTGKKVAVKSPSRVNPNRKEQ